ncbi:type II toxin-antitoxin system VapC family toxin [Prosthecobacter sp.]|uniref:type II toxin-antitoxin system VapC family toxin n=1 Tax=Prosthecobacter sp. TaxID=1965333 RepID=UPI003784CED3
MTLPDTNIWLALALSKHTHHAAASAWLDEQEETGSIFFCRSTQQSLLRLLTTAGVMSVYGNSPLSNKDAWEVYESFIADDRIEFRQESSGLNAIWKKLAARRTSSPKLWMDSYLASFAVASGMQLITTDKAFTQFPGLDARVIQAEV